MKKCPPSPCHCNACTARWLSKAIRKLPYVEDNAPEAEIQADLDRDCAIGAALFAALELVWAAEVRPSESE